MPRGARYRLGGLGVPPPARLPPRSACHPAPTPGAPSPWRPRLCHQRLDGHPQAPTTALDRALPLRDATRTPGRCSPRAPARLCRGLGGPVPAVPLARRRGTLRTVPALAGGDSRPRCGEPARTRGAPSRVGECSLSWRDTLSGRGELPGGGRCLCHFSSRTLGAQRCASGAGSSRSDAGA
jgi:hypothetical protein